MSEGVNQELPLFCPKPDCPCYQRTDNTITKEGVYTTKNDEEPRQLYKCHGGNHRFSETQYSELGGKHGSMKEYEQVCKMSSYGLSAEQIADVLGHDVRTIRDWLEAIGKKSQSFHLFICQLFVLKIEFIQMDEIWSFLKSKGHQLWVFISLESKCKFWINFELGSRTNNTAGRLVSQLKTLIKLPVGVVLKITTDKLAAYKNALEKYFSGIRYAYLQIVKRRKNRRLLTVKKEFVKGTEQDFPEGTQNTSFIERFNLTLRQKVYFLARKTLSYCKSKTFAKHILWINLFNYNYVQFNRSLREKICEKVVKFKKCYEHYTPAMKMGLTRSPLKWRFLLVAPIPLNS